MGLGAAWRLHELGHPHWQVAEATCSPGGGAASVVDPMGFTWDLAGPPWGSHYPYFDACARDWLGGQWVPRAVSAWVWMRGRFIPQPLHHHLDRLPVEEQAACREGLRAREVSADPQEPPRNLLDWMHRNYGEGLAECFAVPYHTKRWVCPPSRLSAGWMHVRDHDSEHGPGPGYPVSLHGGAGALWQAACRRLPPGRFRWGQAVAAIHSSARTATLADGTELAYDTLITSMPLHRLVNCITDMPELVPYAERFTYTSTHLIGIGLKGVLPDWFAGKTWIDLPESGLPAFRLTVLSNCSPHNVPQSAPHWSLLCEVSESSDHPLDRNTLATLTLKSLRREGLIPPEARIASLWQHWKEYGSPTPFYGRDAILEAIQPRLKQRGIYSRGRFGGWKYEISHPDHSMMQGKEVVDELLCGVAEQIYCQPEAVNTQRSG